MVKKSGHALSVTVSGSVLKCMKMSGAAARNVKSFPHGPS